MGGFRSTRWRKHQKKGLVENCLKITTTLFKDDLFKGIEKDGFLGWPIDGEPEMVIAYKTFALNHNLAVRLTYDKYIGGEDHLLDYSIPIVSSERNFGGYRRWFRCPLIVDGKRCRRRCGKLYLPPWGLYFGCRDCLQLTYKKSQQAHKNKNLFNYNAELRKLRKADELELQLLQILKTIER